MFSKMALLCRSVIYFLRVDFKRILWKIAIDCLYEPNALFFFRVLGHVLMRCVAKNYLYCNFYNCGSFVSFNSNFILVFNQLKTACLGHSVAKF